MYEKGEPGVSVELSLELKLIADVGLVGFPNAGKSTLLSSISAARPKIADYPFTTLSPNLGVAQYGGKNFVVADIPGLIEGAHTGKGLGDEFLRHIERTRVLVHIVDLFGFDEQSAFRNYKTINKELEQYSKKLASKKMLVAANKTDLTDSGKKLAELKRRLKGKKIYSISAVTGKGVDVLLGAVIKELSKPAAEEPVEEPVRRYIYEPDFVVSRDSDGTYVISGKKIEKLAEMSDFNEDESLRRFQNILKKMGVEKALVEKGAQVGDMVRIGTLEFEYQK
jgi:GTP-binding protein